MRTIPLVVAALAAGARAVLAQGECYPGPDSHEAKVVAIYSVAMAYSPVDAPRVEDRRFRLTLEGTYLPDIDEETSTPTICRPGKGPENTNLLFGFIRPRVLLRLGKGFALDASWVPPIEVKGVKPNIFGLALGWSRQMSSSMKLGLRAHTTLGHVNAPVTCPQEALQDPTSECFGGTESDDRYEPHIYGADATLGFNAAGGRLHPYVGGGYNRLEPVFQVNFTNSQGSLDDRQVFVELNRVAVFGGVAWQAGAKISLVGEVYSVPVDATTGRVVVSYRP